MRWETALGAITAATCWTIGYLTTYCISVGVSAASNYSLIVAWWLTAYVSSKLRIPLSSAFFLSLAYFGLFLLLASRDTSWFYKDALHLPPAALLGVGIAQAILIGSPVAFDWAVNRAFSIVRS